MSEIMNIFTSIKPEDFDADITFDKVLKQWEAESLGGSENFSYPLEFDQTFANAAEPTKSHEQVNNSNLFAQLFNRDFIKSIDKSLFINEDTMDFISSKNKSLENGQIANITKITVRRSSDTIGKFLIRFKLKSWVNKENVGQLLGLLKDASVNITMGGTSIYRIPKFMLVYLICEQLGNPITLFDVQEFMETHNVDEIKKLVCVGSNNYSSSFSNRYFSKGPTDKYLDIPVLYDFFSYGMTVPMIAMQYHDVRFEIEIPNYNIPAVSKYIEGISLVSDDICYYDTEYRRALAQKPYELFRMGCSINYWHSHTEQVIKLSHGLSNLKFLFVFIRPTDEFLLDENVCISDLPQLESVELTKTEEYHQVSTYAIDLSHIYMATFDNIIVYGIAVDGFSNMKDWIKVTKECGGAKDLFKTEPGSKSGFNNFKPEALNDLYKVIRTPEKTKIKLTPYSIPISVEVYEINQNIQSVMSGMTGLSFN